MTRYLFTSHDGYGLGHVRRNVVLARAVLDRDPEADVTIVTGVRARPHWLRDPRLRVVAVPALTKGPDGRYAACVPEQPLAAGGAQGPAGVARVLAVRRSVFRDLVECLRPDVVVVDRHPLGVGGELTDGLRLASRQGARLVLGLRDVLDEASTVAAELAGPAWRAVPGLFDEVVVYGDRELCDHQREYGMAVAPTYLGWVVERPEGSSGAMAPVGGPVDERTVIVAAGGGADGDGVYALGVALAASCPDRRVMALVGPEVAAGALDGALPPNLELHRPAGSCLPLFLAAGAVVQMAGYNSTVEALVAGLRPILVPRRHPRREQAIRAARLAALGLADVVDERADPGELSWLLARPRHLPGGALRRAGLGVDGAARAAELFASMRAVAA